MHRSRGPSGRSPPSFLSLRDKASTSWPGRSRESWPAIDALHWSWSARLKKKHGFALPFGVWLLRDARLMSFASAALESLRDRGVIAAGLVDAVVQARNAPAAAYYGELVWVMMVLEHWLLAHAPAFRAT